MEDNTYSLIEENNEIKKGKLEQLLKKQMKKIIYFLTSITMRLGEEYKEEQNILK